MEVLITEYANDLNFVEEIVGERIGTFVFDYKDYFGIQAEIYRLLSEKADFEVNWCQENTEDDE